MSYVSLYRKYRPKSFSDVVGQDIVIKILQNSIKNNKISHAYIFSGPRGTGKTTVAKIFSKVVNCINNSDDICNNCPVCNEPIENQIDIVEIDAASNNGVDEIREIRNNVKLLPNNLKYKVYIIDEVHMLSTSAFNALLKTLEEPPKHAIFILATTEFNKIPATVVSRCQKFDFKKIDIQTNVCRLKYILKQEKRTLNDNVIELIAKLSNGGLRDSINLLEQVLNINKKNVEVNDIYNLIGEINDDEIFELLKILVSGDIKSVIQKLDIYDQEGRNFINISNRLEELIKNIIIYNSTDNYFESEYENKLNEFSKVDYNLLLDISKILFELITELKKTNNQKILSEIYFLKITLLFSKKNDKEVLNNKTSNDESNNDESNINNDTEEEILEEINKNKKIRINNTFVGANKILKQNFVKKYSLLKDYLSNKEYNSIANLLLKGEPCVVSDKNIIFKFKNDFECVLFDKNLEDIQKLLKMLYNKKYIVVAISNEEWNEIKKEYISNIKKGVEYKYIDEIVKKSTKKNTESENSLESIFGNEYTEL